MLNKHFTECPWYQLTLNMHGWFDRPTHSQFIPHVLWLHIILTDTITIRYDKIRYDTTTETMTAAAFAPSSFVAASRSLDAALLLPVQHHALVLPSSSMPSLPLPSSMLLLSTTVTEQQPATSFDPILPETSTLVGMGVIVALCVAAAIVWNTQVVPVSRTKLALSKSKGDVKEYLDELRDADDDDNRKVEQWLFTDWLDKSKTKKAPAVPFLKKAKWNSGDNPVVVTAAMMMVGIVVASFTERVFQ